MTRTRMNYLYFLINADNEGVSFVTAADDFAVTMAR